MQQEWEVNAIVGWSAVLLKAIKHTGPLSTLPDTEAYTINIFEQYDRSSFEHTALRKMLEKCSKNANGRSYREYHFDDCKHITNGQCSKCAKVCDDCLDSSTRN